LTESNAYLLKIRGLSQDIITVTTVYKLYSLLKYFYYQAAPKATQELAEVHREGDETAARNGAEVASSRLYFVGLYPWCDPTI